MFRLVVILALASHLICLGCSPAAPRVAESTPRIASGVLPNAFWLHERVISGGLPEGDAAFEELAKLRVQTIISVDGARPDVATAKKFGLRYVHLPHGYDGISETRVQEIAKAVRDLPGVVYIHCHHGKHRSPAAATAACVTLGYVAPEMARSILKTAGTSDNYRGLYQSAETARKIDAAVLDALQVEFVETAKTPPLVDAMIAIEHTHDKLKMLAANGWKTPADHPALDAAHEALLLREHFTELLRTDETMAAPAKYQELLRSSEREALALENCLADGKLAGAEAAVTAKATAAFERVTKSCGACHQTYRDAPKK